MIAETASFYVTGGTMPRGAPSYVARAADEELFNGLRQGEFCYVLTARQMGKSSLMVRTADRLRREGVAVAVLDLTAIGCNLTAEQWYAGLLASVGRQLGLEDETEAFWDSPGVTEARLGPLQRWMVALREVVLAHTPGPVVLFVDEIDVVRALPFSTDEFFAAVRECYNRRSEDPEFHRLAFCLLGVTTPSELIRDPRTTPFNIGRRIELNDFTFEEALPLAAGLVSRKDAKAQSESEEGQQLLRRVLHWTGGHPYLTQRLCCALAERIDADPDPSVPTSLCAFAPLREPSARPVDQTCAATFLSHRAQDRDDNLNLVRERLLGGAVRDGLDLAALLTLYEQVWRGRRVADDETNPLIAALRLSGLVRVEGNGQAPTLRVRNRIYAQVFDREWIVARMPGAELRRQRAAYRRGLMRASAVAAVVLFLLSGLTASAIANARSTARYAARLKKTETALRLALREQQVMVARLQEEVNERKRQTTRARDAAARADQSGRRAALNEREARRQARRARASAGAERHARDAAEQRRRESQDSYSKLLTRQGIEALDDERLFEAILRLSQALKTGRPAGEAERIRITSLGRQLPRLAYLRADVRDAAFGPVGRRVALALGDETVRLHDLEEHRERFQVRHGGGGSAAFSADGRLLTRGADWMARVWAPTGTLLAGPFRHRDELLMAAISGDGRHAITASRDRTAIIWAVATGRPAVPPLQHPEPVACVAFSPDGERVATVSGHELRIWERASGRLLLGPLGAHPDIRAVSFSPDGARVLVQAFRWRPILFDARSGTAMASPSGDLCSAISPDSRRLAAGSTDGLVHFVDLATGAAAVPPMRHRDAVDDLCFSPDNRYLATASSDSTARIWDRQTGAPVTPPLPHGAAVRRVMFSPDGRSLLTRDAGGTARVWDLPAAPLSRLVAATAPLRRLAVSRDGRHFVTAAAEGAQRWKAASRTGEPPLAIGPALPHGGELSGLVVSDDGARVAVARTDGTVRVWDGTTNRLLHTLRHPQEVTHLAFSPGRNRLAAISGDRIAVWDLATGARRREFTGGTGWGALTGVSFSPDGRRIVVSGDMHSATAWDVETGAMLKHASHGDRIPFSAFSPDGRFLATAGNDAQVQLWDTRSWQVIHTLPHAGPVVHLAFSGDGRQLLTASGNPAVQSGAAYLWNVQTGQLAAAPMRHAGQVLHAAFSQDGAFAVTAAADRTARVWEVATGDPVTPPLRHAAEVTQATFLAGPGRRVLTLNRDGRAQVWELPQDRHSPEALAPAALAARLRMSKSD